MPHIGPYFMNKPGFKQVGTWGWDNERLHSKIDTKPDRNGCLNWKGAMSPSGALMGAWKSRDGVMKQQMTQVRRLVQMDETNEDIGEYQIKLTCANQKCCNRLHFKLMPNNRIAASKPQAEKPEVPKLNVVPVPAKAKKPRAKKWWEE